MSKSIYLATSLNNQIAHKRLMTKLSEEDWRCTYDWTTYGSTQNSPDRQPVIAMRENLGVEQANIVGVLLPGGRGTHAELGMALAYEKPVILYAESDDNLKGSDDYICIFYRHPLVTRVRTVEDFIATAEDLAVLVGYDRCSIESDLHVRT